MRPRASRGCAGSTASERSGDARGASGRGLVALANDEMPEAEDLAGLRRAMREVLSHHLGGRGLKSWELVAGLSRPVRGLGQDDSMS